VAPDENSNIGRWVAFLLGPLALLFGGFVAAKAKSWFNYDLAPAEAAAYFLTIVGGIAALLFKWLHNRGKYELAKATGISSDTIDLIASAVVTRLPQAPQAPQSPPLGTAGSQAPPPGR
jgi:hypothetical protein